MTRPEKAGALFSFAPEPTPTFFRNERHVRARHTIAAIEGNKLEIDFEHAGRKKVLDSFVSIGWNPQWGGIVAIEDLSDRAIQSVVQRYRAQGKTEGGPYSLSELLLEQRRRKPSKLPIDEVSRFIISRSKKSPDGLVTYKEIWEHFRPGQVWMGHGSQSVVKDALFRVVGYCAEHRLPVLTVLVVQTQSRKLSDSAVENIYRECKELGVDVGLVPRDFVKRETERSRLLSEEKLPSSAF
jgi:hypothetical protein